MSLIEEESAKGNCGEGKGTIRSQEGYGASEGVEKRTVQEGATSRQEAYDQKGNWRWTII